MRRFWVVLSLAVLAACGRGSSVTTPNAVASLSQWSPYVGMHSFDWSLNVQQPFLQPLLDNGSIRGVRLEYFGPDTQSAASWLLANGATDVLGILPDSMLKPDTCAALEMAVHGAPAIRYWEIGNEVQLFTAISPQEYAPIFAAAAACVVDKGLDVIVIPAAPVGNMGGQDFLRGILDAGVLKLADGGRVPILALHYYSTGSTFMPDVARQVQRLPANTEIWVTETGVDSQAAQVDFVREQYPRIHASWRATRIYWYVFSECSGYSLVGGLASPCKTGPSFSPLYNLLKGGGR
ncbi:MAG TPA: glycosyl hydrolase [Candidatus Paceibacterota bacterium]|nr:glycosyl hydrolase [Candidatus Paceibacterota bacterium]